MEIRKNIPQSTEQMAKIQKGFKIIKVVLRDQDTQEIFWDSQEKLGGNLIEGSSEYETILPQKILNSRAITRQINFSSIEKLEKLKLIQKAYLGTELIEIFKFDFGFVIPNSVNQWDQTILGANPDQMLSADVLSGNLIVKIGFYEADELIYEIKLKFYYQ